MKKIKIYVAAHKEANFPDNPMYVPIEVGAYNKENFLKVTDNTGDNISEKNPFFCELTATYWILKNDLCDIVGLTHYRRFFFKKHTNKMEFILKKKDIEEILSDYDIIVPIKTYLVKYKNIKEAYANIHHIADYELCRKIIEEKYPSYLDAFDIVSNSRSFYACNMFISSKKIFDKYYNWLFDILFELEKRIDITSYDDYNRRIFGFLSERLFNVWLCHENLKVKEMPVYNTHKKFLLQYLDYKVKRSIFR